MRTLAAAVCLAIAVVACTSSSPSPAPVLVVTPSVTPIAVGTGLVPSATTSQEPTPSASPRPSVRYDATYVIANCTPQMTQGGSVARYWDETALNLVRRDPPAPTVVARNLFDLSAVMWDAWAAYDPTAVGYFVNEKHSAPDVAQARVEAISYAAYNLLRDRYFGGQADVDENFALQMQQLCLWPNYSWPVASNRDTPGDLGVGIARAAIAAGHDDGSLQDSGYVDSSYTPVNDPLKIAQSGVTMEDPNKWQPLEFPRGQAQGQGGRPAPDIQSFVGAQWGHVAPFALPASTDGVAIDPGPPPALGSADVLDQEYKQAAIDVLKYSSTLDPSDGVTEDISPASMGNNTLGTNDGQGRAINPVTSQPYSAEIVPRADYERALAEFWADGPDSETPPGHWNLIANTVSDSPGFEFRFAGGAPITDRLEWDVKMYLALNGALHDAAIAAWGLKRDYDSARPISMIRYLAQRGQSSDPALPNYDREGIPLVPGLVELITKDNSTKGQPLYALRDHMGEIAVLAWLGFPQDPTTETSGVGWILAVDWVPYQRPTFVTPSFPGYISGHSTFSRAAAEVLTGLTGSEFFPGGLMTWPVPQGSLLHEYGPTQALTFEWATYYDAADSAGQSRQYMGIHISEDDFVGRQIGSQAGQGAWALAQKFFNGSASPPA